MIKLTVIIPGYNTSDKMWERCLSSVLRAIPSDTEIICIDDGSQARPRVKVVDTRIRWIYLGKNIGQSAARNRAMEVARGEFISFVDSDDEVGNDVYYQLLFKMSETNADIGMFGVRTIWVNERLHKCNVPAERLIEAVSANDVKEMFEECLLEYVWNKVFRKSFLDRFGLRFRENICPGEDTIFVLECLAHKPRWLSVGCVGYLYYRMDGTSLSRYQPTYAESMRLKEELWYEVCGTPMSESALRYHQLMVWENMWRHGAPYGWRDKLMFAQENQMSFCKTLIKRFVRKYLYVRPLRRWWIRRTMKGVVDLEAVK